MLDEYVRSTILVEQLKSQLHFLRRQNTTVAGEFTKLVPLGAEMRRIKREVELAEQDYLAQVEGLKQSRLTQENTELASSQFKVLDPPNFPASAPDKTFLLTLAVSLLLSYCA
jgi:capsule polysaccharide export protein KpsE/RkpR